MATDNTFSASIRDGCLCSDMDIATPLSPTK